jgi:phenylalanyl-tRNA synthetase alpha chain
MADMTQKITKLKDELKDMISAANDLQALEQARVTALGKKGKITDLMKTLGQMDAEERKATGQALNVLKGEIAELINKQETSLKRQAMDERLATETIDVSLSTRPERKGYIHPISQTIDELVSIFADMGFSIADGPDIEDDWHNFTALNFPPGHPAREMHDTFYLPDDEEEEGEAAKKLLRTHTSSVQIRHMIENKPPMRIIVMGRTYRSDYDMTHTPMFHQIEGLVIDKETNMGHLKGCLTDFCRSYFEVSDLPVRFRPSFFPFTEPSAEMDIGCSRKGGGLKIGHGDDWMEILGCGMVHPNVLKNCGLDPDEYQGFAFGMGVERIAMLKYGIPDLRTFFDSDSRWLEHYGFDPKNRPNRATRS